jgi:hypothetical protein
MLQDCDAHAERRKGAKSWKDVQSGKCPMCNPLCFCGNIPIENSWNVLPTFSNWSKFTFQNWKLPTKPRTETKRATSSTRKICGSQWVSSTPGESCGDDMRRSNRNSNCSLGSLEVMDATVSNRVGKPSLSEVPSKLYRIQRLTV